MDASLDRDLAAWLDRQFPDGMVPFTQSGELGPAPTGVPAGQERFFEALDHGLALRSPGSHIVVTGPTDAGFTARVGAWVAERYVAPRPFPVVLAQLTGNDASRCQIESHLATEADLDGLQHPEDEYTRKVWLNRPAEARDQRRGLVVEHRPSFPILLGRYERLEGQGAAAPFPAGLQVGSIWQALGGVLVLGLDEVEPALTAELLHILDTGRIDSRRLVPRDRAAPRGFLDIEAEFQTKVVAILSRKTYSHLLSNNPTFARHFRVPAEWEDVVPDSAAAATQLLASLAARHGFDREGAGLLLSQARRLAQAQDRLPADTQALARLLDDAAGRAALRGHPMVSAADLRAAIEAAHHREGRASDKLALMVRDGAILVDTEGQKVGEVNSLAVLTQGHAEFGRVNKVTASAGRGSKGIVAIDREAKLSGKVHDKGVFVLTGFLLDRFGGESPLNFTAHLGFEQNYGGIDGDSASLAELVALLSALGSLPVRQDWAITGSLNQKGRVQAVGGVAAKIEGFFDVCAARGLTGQQGVILPRANLRHLTLREDLRQAVREARFHLRPVTSAEEVMELLCGKPWGPTGDRASVAGAVAEGLRRLGGKELPAGSTQAKEARDATPAPKPSGPPEGAGRSLARGPGLTAGREDESMGTRRRRKDAVILTPQGLPAP